MSDVPSNPSSILDMEELEFKRKNLPDKPGVYIYKNEDGTIIYVGKAKSLRKRVNSYWKDHHSEDPIYADKINRLVAQIRDIDVFIVENETEALLLEHELIKKYQPYFNAMAKDDKSYPWVMITNERFPRIKIIRGRENYGLQHKYIGPFVDVTDVRYTLAQVRKLFPFCTCKRCIDQQRRTKPCLYYQIKLCPGPCTGKISEEQYLENIHHVEELLNGNIEEIHSIFQKNMQEAASKLEFEQATVWRNRIQALQTLTQNQSIFTPDINQLSEKEGEGFNWDIVAGHTTKTRVGLIIIHVRKGRLLGKTPYIVQVIDKITDLPNFFLELLQQHYLRPDIPIPDGIVTEQPLPDEFQLLLQQYFHTRLSGAKEMQFLLPQEENKSAGLLRIAKKNIELLLTQKDEYEKFIQEQAESVVDRDVRQKGLIELQETLNLDDPPSIIECFDMSNTQGTDPVGSMVTFVEGRPSKGHYRRFKVRSKTTPDDVAMMRETMGRRYERALKERQTFPDLILVDGGKGQLNMAHQLLQDLGIDYIPHIGLAKREEEIFVYDQEQPIILEKDSLGLHILQAIRDEAHRFANTYHRLLRTKRQTQSILDDIPGIGPARKKKLLLYFGSTAEIRKATMEQVANLVGSTLATEIMQYLQTHPEETLAPKRRVKKTSKKAVLSHSSEDTELSPK